MSAEAGCTRSRGTGGAGTPASHPAPRTEDAPAGHFDIESFADYAELELRAYPLARPGLCANPDCSRPFSSGGRFWKRYCGQGCARADEAEIRRIGQKAAPALLALQMGRYAKPGTPAQVLHLAAWRYLRFLAAEWLRHRRGRARIVERGR